MTSHMKLDEKALREILDGCEGVTPGPWYTTGSPWFAANDGVLAGSPDGNIGYLIADCDDAMSPRDEYTQSGGAFPLGDKDADAAHIARLDPQTVASIVTELLEQRASHAPQGGVRVKPLQWTQKAPPGHTHEAFVYWAAGVGGHYRAERDGLLWMAHDAFVWKQYPTQKDAKAAAQADYERRILSALNIGGSND